MPGSTFTSASASAPAAAGHYYLPCPPNTGVTVNGRQGFHNQTAKNFGPKAPYFLLPLTGVAVVAGPEGPFVNLAARDFDDRSDRWVEKMEAAEGGLAASAGPVNQAVASGQQTQGAGTV